MAERWYTCDPEDEDIQDGDEGILEELGEDGLKAMRASREERRLTKKARHLLEIENNQVHQVLKPLIDSIIPRMKYLQVLEVKRRKYPKWSDFPTVYKQSHVAGTDEPPSELPITWYPFIDTGGQVSNTYIDIALADEAKHALSIAVYQRSKNMEAAKRVLQLTKEPGNREAMVAGEGEKETGNADGDCKGNDNAGAAGGFVVQAIKFLRGIFWHT